jgi:hypothetical protein
VPHGLHLPKAPIFHFRCRAATALHCTRPPATDMRAVPANRGESMGKDAARTAAASVASAWAAGEVPWCITGHVPRPARTGGWLSTRAAFRACSSSPAPPDDLRLAPSPSVSWPGGAFM